MSSPHPSSEEIFHRLLGESSALLAAPESRDIAIPDDELHREILVPLLPAMLADAAIRGHWSEQHATGFVTRIGRYFENGDPAPRWTPDDFEIHVTASYSASPDARALADTLLSEDSLREMTAALMNQLLDALWPKIAPQPVKAAAVAAEIPAQSIIEFTKAEAVAEEEKIRIAGPAVAEISEPLMLPEPETKLALPVEIAEAVPLVENVAERAVKIPTVQFQTATHSLPSRTLIRALCRKLSASDFQFGFAANSAPHNASAAIVARRIAMLSTKQRTRSGGTRASQPIRFSRIKASIS